MLTYQQSHEFKALLEQRYRELREIIRQELIQSDQQTFIELAGQVQDMENSSVADLLVDVALADIDRHVEEIRDVDAALMRIAEGNYGVCTDCDEAIEVKRLEAYPTAKRCRPCQENYENRSAGPRHTSL